MYSIKRLMVGLDFTPIDEQLIAYAYLLQEVLNIEKISFFHTSKDLELTKEQELCKGEGLTTEETLKACMLNNVQQVFKGEEKCKYEVALKHGKIPEDILKWAKAKDIDLILMGKKTGTKTADKIPGKVAKLSKSSILIYPSDARQVMKKIVVLVDFSEHSKTAVQAAVAMGQHSPVDITCLHVYNLPIGWYKTGKSKEDYTSILGSNAEKSYKKLLEGMEHDNASIRLESRFADEESPAKVMFNYAEKEGADLLVIGSKGRTQAAEVLLGSMAVKILELDKSIPLMVVKNKADNMDFLEALANM